MSTYSLRVDPIAGVSTQGTGNRFNLQFNENLAAGTVIGKLVAEGSQAAINAWGVDKNNVTFTAPILDPDIGLDGTNFNRFEIVRALAADTQVPPRWAANDWIVRVKEAVSPTTGASKFDYEFADDFANGMVFNGTTGANNWNINFSTTLKDVNEAPKNVVHDGTPVQSGQSGAPVGLLNAYDEDDAFWTNEQAVITYVVDTGLNSNLFEIINGRTLKVKDGQSLSYAGAPKVDGTSGAHYYEVNIKVTDGGGYVGGEQDPVGSPAQSRVETVRVYVVETQVANPTIMGNATTVGVESAGGTFVMPFAGNRLNVDHENDTDRLTVQVSFAAANGEFDGETAGGDATTKIYTFTGVRGDVNEWLASLQFNPMDKFSGIATTTTFTVQVKPEGASTWSATNSNVKVAADINDNASGDIPDTDMAATVGTSMNPFAGITVWDNEGDTVTLTITFTPGGTWTGLMSTTGPNAVTVVNQSATGTITFTGNAGDVSNFLDNVGYTPASAGTKAFNVSVVDAFSGAGQHTAADLDSFNVVAVAQNPDPTLSVTATTYTMESTGANIAPFNGKVTINDATADRQTLEISFASGHGILVGQTFTDDGTTRVYTFTDTTANLNTLLANLQFNPDDKFGGGTVNTTFTIKVKPEGATNWSVTNNTGILVQADDNDNATGTVDGGMSISAAVNLPVNPFAGITITDEPTDQVTLTVTFAAGTGTWTGLADTAAVDVNDNGAITGNRIISFTGTAADVTAFLDNVAFTPSGVGNTAFSFTVKDSGHTSSNTISQITVNATNNGVPGISVNGATAFTATNQGAVDAFDAVTITDAEAADEITMTIRFTATDGELKGINGVVVPAPSTSGTDKIYEFKGTKTALTNLLHDLQFDPTDRAVGGATQTTTLKISVSDTDNPTPITNSQIEVASTPPQQNNNAPTGLTLNGSNGVSILEYTAVGTEIGTLAASDANAGDVLTYKLLDDAGGRFAIVGNKLKLAGAGVNFEEAMSHQIKVQVSDGKGGVTEQVFTVGVGDQTTLNKRGTKKSDKLNGTVQDDILKGGAGTVKDTIKGLAGDDKLYGEGGNDSVLGGDGIDSLYGGAGNDTLKGEAGKDLLKGDAGNDMLYGGLGIDMLYGGAGNDTLKGDADNDVLFGEAGNDKLYGGAGNDTFVFNKKASKAANFDRIYDFKSGQDKLFLDNAVFKKLGTLGTFDVPAKLDVSMFKAGKAKDKNDYLVYKSGILYYDADGSGKGAAVEIVKLSGLKVTDIFVI